jgi:hypothetical protein
MSGEREEQDRLAALRCQLAELSELAERQAELMEVLDAGPDHPDYEKVLEMDRQKADRLVERFKREGRI